MNHALSYVKRIIIGFWKPRKQYDYLEMEYARMADGWSKDVNEEELATLIARREKAVRQKKKASDIQRQINTVKAKIILNEMRSK